MGQIRQSRHLAICVALLVLAGWAIAVPPDPVEDLKQILRLRDPLNPTAQMLEFRRQAMARAVGRLQTPGDLRRALALAEWKRSISADPVVAKIETDARNEIGQRFVQLVERVVENGDATSRLAVANMIAEIGPNVRSLKDSREEFKDPEARGGFARSLAPLMAKLARGAGPDGSRRSVAVRQEALRALGSINADPKIAVPELASALSDPEVGPRRVAADALLQMIKIVAHLSKESGTESGAKALSSDVIHVASAALAASRAGLRDPDPQVVSLCLEAAREAANALNEQVQPRGQDAKDFPPKDKESQLSDQAFRNAILADLGALKPLATEIDKHALTMVELLRKIEQAPIGGRAPVSTSGYLSIEERQARFTAIDALENIAYARIRMQRHLESVPIKEIPKDAKEGGGERDLGEFDPLKSFLADRSNLVQITHLLEEPDPRVRRRTVEFFELLEDRATTAIPALTVHLADSDRFVRWAAARALGRIGPALSARAVPGLARLLEDPDLNVRRAAAETLGIFAGFSELASALPQAVPFLARAVNTSNTEVRMTAMTTLLTFGPDLARPAVPALAAALNPEVAPDARVRESAAQTLGRLGPTILIDPQINQADAKLVGIVIPALRRAIGDEDPAVRAAASDALLSLIPPPRKL